MDDGVLDDFSEDFRPLSEDFTRSLNLVRGSHDRCRTFSENSEYYRGIAKIAEVFR